MCCTLVPVLAAYTRRWGVSSPIYSVRSARMFVAGFLKGPLPAIPLPLTTLRRYLAGAGLAPASSRARPAHNRDREGPHGLPPPTPPGLRLTYQGGSVTQLTAVEVRAQVGPAAFPRLSAKGPVGLASASSCALLPCIGSGLRRRLCSSIGPFTPPFGWSASTDFA